MANASLYNKGFLTTIPNTPKFATKVENGKLILNDGSIGSKLQTNKYTPNLYSDILAKVKEPVNTTYKPPVQQTTTGPGITTPTQVNKPLLESMKAETPQITTPATKIGPQVQASEGGDYLADLQTDINNGIPLSEVSKLYPELGGDETVISQLYTDLKAGMPLSEIPNLYPELGQEKEQGFLSKVGSAYFKPIQTLGEEIVKKPVDRFLDYVQGRDLDPANTYTGSDIWKTTGAGVSAGFNAGLPGISAGFNVAGSTKTGEKVLGSLPGQVGVGAALGGAAGGKKGAVLGGAIGTIPGATDYILNNVPGLKDYYNSLDEEGKEGMQGTISGLAMVGAGAVAGKYQGKTPKQLADKLNKLPENVSHGIVDAIKTMPDTIKTKIQSSKEAKFAKGTEEIYQAVNPTTRENKAQLRQRVNDLLPYIDEKSPLQNELAQVKQRVEADKMKAGEDMKNYEQTIGVKGVVETNPIIKQIQDKFIEKTSEGVIIDEATANIANQLIGKLKEFGPKLKDTDIIKVRRNWDKIIEKNKGFMQSAESNIKGDIFNEANKYFREEIRKSNPEYADYLKQYSKTTALSDILEATIQRRTGQSQGGYLRRGLENVARVAGVGLGATVGGVPGAIIGDLATEVLIKGTNKLTGSSMKLAKGKKLILNSNKNGTSNNNIRTGSNTSIPRQQEQLTSGPRLENKQVKSKTLIPLNKKIESIKTKEVPKEIPVKTEKTLKTPLNTPLLKKKVEVPKVNKINKSGFIELNPKLPKPLKPKVSDSLIESKVLKPDGVPNIGTEWDSPYGRQRISKINNTPTGVDYEVETISGKGKGDVRMYGGYNGEEAMKKIKNVISSNQESITPEYINKREIERLKVEKDIKEEKLYQENRKKEYNDIDGFKSDKSNLIQSNIKEALDKKERYQGEIISRKDKIKKMIKEGRTFKSQEYSNRSNDNKRVIYGAYKDNNTFLEITKTEFEYAQYLKNR